MSYAVVKLNVGAVQSKAPLDRIEAELLQHSAGTKQGKDLAAAHIRSNLLLESAGMKPNALETASRESKLLLASAEQNSAVASSIENKESRLLLETSKFKPDQLDRFSEAYNPYAIEGDISGTKYA